MMLLCKGSWHRIRVFYKTIRSITRAKNRVLRARENSMSSIERQIRISKQDPIPPTTNETVNFYHGQNFFKKYFLEIFDPAPVPLSKITPFDAARRALSNDVFQITNIKTNVTILVQKCVKQASKQIFHQPIRSRTCATWEKYSIRLTLKFSIHQYIVLHYQRKKPKSNFYKTLRT